MVWDNAEQHPTRVVLSRPAAAGDWQPVTTTEFRDQVMAVAKGLIAAGVRPGDRVGLMSRTRYEWTLLDFAIWSAGGVTVPVYETSSAEQIQWGLGDSGAGACVVESTGHESTVESVRHALPTLKHVWRIEGDAVGRLRALGSDVPDAAVDEAGAIATADSPATIVYTSGTTGRPKGC